LVEHRNIFDNLLLFGKEKEKLVKPQLKHGLTISMRPTTEFVFYEGANDERAQIQGANADQDTPLVFDLQNREDVNKVFVTYNQKLLDKLFATTLLEEDDAYSLKTITTAQQFLFLHITQDTSIIHNNSIALFLYCDKNAKLTIKSHNAENQNSSITCRVHAVHVAGELELDHQIVGSVISHKKHIVLNAKLDIKDVISTKTYVRDYVQAILEKPQAQSQMHVAYLTKENAVCDVFTEHIHVCEQTHSNIVTRGVLCDTSKALSRGRIEIGKDAKQSDAYEKQDALLLSSNAEADAIPMLLIHNHDVKCSHGSTVGQLDSEILFYMMSRGLSQEQAELELVKGYFGDLFTLEM
jgi:hypothetical protein